MSANHVTPSSAADTSLTVVLPLAFVAVFMAFACWTLLAVMGVHLKETLALTSTAFGLLLATPVLAGGLMAIPLGLAVQAYGGRKVILCCLAGLSLVLASLMLVESYAGLLFVAGGLGLSAGLFISGLNYVVSHSPVARIGLALGCCGSGMSGAAFSYLAVPLIHEAYSWQAAPLAYVLVLCLTMVLILLLTERDPPSGRIPELRQAVKALRRSHLSAFGLNYSVLFGGFMALALWLPDYLSAQYDIALRQAASLAMMFIIPGALAQIAGGSLADSVGPRRVLRWALAACLLALLVLSYPPMSLSIRGIDEVYLLEFRLPLVVAMGLLIVLSGVMGVGLGSLLRQLYDIFPNSVGIAGGATLLMACGAAFALPLLFGVANDLVGVRNIAFMLLFGMILVALVVSEWIGHIEERQRFMEETRRLEHKTLG